MTLEQQRNLLLAIERNAEIEGPHKDTAIEIINTGLESYLPQRTLLEAEPFGQEFRNKEAIDKEINEAIERLKNRQNQSVDTTAVSAPR